MQMIWRGDDCDKFYANRWGYKPFVIVNHITVGTASSVYNWFTSPNNNQASSHFVVCRSGEVNQYVRIEDGAWTQGRDFPIPGSLAPRIAPVVLNMGTVNPNLYCVSIEFEGYEGQGVDGTLTDAQFYAGCWLHRYIKEEIKRLYGYSITLGSYNVIGHFQIDPIRKPFCPGLNFPWQRLYAELAVADHMSLEDYEGRITYLQSPKNQKVQCYQVGNEIEYLFGLIDTNDEAAEWAKGIYRSLYPVFASLGILEDRYSETADYTKFHNDVLYIYDCAQGLNGEDVVAWGIDCLVRVYPHMLQNGLVA